jgi:hypothetical protein
MLLANYQDIGVDKAANFVGTIFNVRRITSWTWS